MPKTWQQLPLRGHGPSQPLYVRSSTGPGGYDVVLTDLTHVWSESLTRKQVIATALKCDTSIDPSEGDDQYFVLLQKIADALCGKEQTALSLSSGTNGDCLKLSTETNLPSPLEPLVWTITLRRMPQKAFTNQVFVPVLRNAVNSEMRMGSLIKQLKVKDWALRKMFDKLDSSGIDLSIVFPSLSNLRHGRKGSVFDQATRLVKGIAPFDETTWEQDAPHRTSSDNTEEAIIQSFSNAEQFDLLEKGSTDWWSKLLDSDQGTVSSTVEQKAFSKQTRVQPEEEDSTESDDDFETKETPCLQRGLESRPQHSKNQISPREAANKSINPDGEREHLTDPRVHTQKEKPKAAKPTPPTDESTESEFETCSRKPRANMGGLRTIGGRKISKTAKPLVGDSVETESDTATSKNGRKKQPEEISTASEDEGESVLRPSKRQKSSPADSDESDLNQPAKMDKTTNKRSTKGLGQIGGNKALNPNLKSKQPSQGHAESEESSKSISPAPKSAKGQNKLGIIGGSKATRGQVNRQSKAVVSAEADISTADDGSDDNKPKVSGTSAQTHILEQRQSPILEAKTEPSASQKSTVPDKETPEERANRKREEIKRLLASKNGPAKKKRKF